MLLLNLKSRLLPFFRTNNFSYRVRGKAGGGKYEQLIENGRTQILISCPIVQAETVQVDETTLTTMNAAISLTNKRAKDVQITLMHRLGMSADPVALQFNLTTTAPGTIKFSPRPGMDLVDLDPGLTKLSVVKLTVGSMISGRTNTLVFDLARSGILPEGQTLDGVFRVKVPIGNAAAKQLTLVSLDNLGTARVLSSGIVIGSSIPNVINVGNLGNLGQLGQLGHP